MSIIKSVIMWLLKVCFKAVILEVTAEIENRKEVSLETTKIEEEGK